VSEHDTMHHPAPAPTYFDAIEPHALRSDRVYRVYVGERKLAGAYVAGQWRDDESLRRQLAQNAWLAYFLRKASQRRCDAWQARLAFYAGVDPFAPSFLTNDARNFHIPASNVLRIRFRRKVTQRAPLHAGVIDFQLADGKRRLILCGEEKADDVIDWLRRLDPAIEVSGQAEKRLPMHLQPRSVRRRDFFSGAGLMLFFAIAIVAMMAWIPDPRLLLAAPASLVTAIVLFYRGWKLRGPDDPPAGAEERGEAQAAPRI